MPRKTDMSFSTFYLRWILLPALWVAGFPLEESEMHTTDRRTADFVAGLVFQLQCDCNSPNESVSWSRVPSQSLENIGGISIKGDVLWFVPAQPVHSGEYSCLCREDDETWEMIFNVSVQKETCPPMNRKDEIKTTEKLECFLPHIFELDPGSQVTWRNNCLPLNVTYGKVFLLNRSSDMVGLYTCFVNFTFEGRNYSAAQTTQIYNQPTDFVVTRPEIIYPKKETHTVTLGEHYNLSCKALVGKNDMDETSIFWISDSESLTLNYTNTILKESGQKYLLSVLSISKVTEEYLNTNLTCTVQHPAGSDSGSVLLLPASQKECHYWIGFGLVALVTLLGAVAFLCRVDLVLAHRGVCPSAARRRGYY